MPSDNKVMQYFTKLSDSIQENTLELHAMVDPAIYLNLYLSLLSAPSSLYLPLAVSPRSLVSPDTL